MPRGFRRLDPEPRDGVAGFGEAAARAEQHLLDPERLRELAELEEAIARTRRRLDGLHRRAAPARHLGARQRGPRPAGRAGAERGGGGVDGLDERATGDGLAVPRRELAGTLRLALKTDRLRVLETPLADVFKAALLGFTMQPPRRGGDDLAALRREPEDDLVIGVALAVWQSVRETPGPRGPAIDPRRSGLGDYDPHAALGRW